MLCQFVICLKLLFKNSCCKRGQLFILPQTFVLVNHLEQGLILSSTLKEVRKWLIS